MKELNNEIKKYANHYGYSDVHPFEVVRVISPITAEIRAMKSELVKPPQDFHPGGFVCHYADNHAQEWNITSQPEEDVTRIRFSKARNEWKGSAGRFIMEDKPRKFYDYNF